MKVRKCGHLTKGGCTRCGQCFACCGSKHKLKQVAEHSIPSREDLLRDLELRGITYIPDLAEEGSGWESAAESEPEYFETLPEAIDHQHKLAVNEALEQAKNIRNG